MAFGQLLNQDEEDEKQATNAFGAPGGGTTAVAAPGGAPAGAFGAPAAQQAPGGSGFVNLQRYMDNASNDRAGQVRNAFTGVMDKEQTRFNEAKKPLEDALGGAIEKAPEEADISKAFEDATTVQADAPIGEGVEIDQTARDAEAAAIKQRNEGGFAQLEKWLGASFDAPTVEYSPEHTSAATMFNLGKASTAAHEVNKDAINSQNPYSIGNELLDRALFEGDGGVKQATDDSKSAVEAFDKNAFDEVTSLNERAQGAETATAETRERVRNALGKRFTDTSAAIDETVRAANEQEQRARAEIEARLGPDAWKEGSGATRENAATAAQRAQFSALSQLLGLDNLGTADRTVGNVQGRTPEAKPTAPAKAKTFESGMNTMTGREAAAADRKRIDDARAALLEQGYTAQETQDILARGADPEDPDKHNAYWAEYERLTAQGAAPDEAHKTASRKVYG
jgi:hypothetical protein